MATNRPVYGGARKIDSDFAIRGHLDLGQLLFRTSSAPAVVPVESRVGFEFKWYGLYIGIPGRDGKWNSERQCFEEAYYEQQYKLFCEKLTPSEADLFQKGNEACVVTMVVDARDDYRISIQSLSHFSSGKPLWMRAVNDSAPRDVLLNRIFRSIGAVGKHCAVKYNNETFALECCSNNPPVRSESWGEWIWSEQGDYLKSIPALKRGLTTALVTGGVATGATCAAAGAGLFTTTVPGVLWGSYVTTMSVGAVLSFGALPIALSAIALGLVAHNRTKAALTGARVAVGSKECIRVASFSEIMAATEKLADKNIIGRGGLGPVYSGRWQGHNVAIKILQPEPGSNQGVPELMREINVHSQFRHQHLVPILAYCISNEDKFWCLVYPRLHMSLEDALLHLRGPSAPNDSFHQRLREAHCRVSIASHIASGLEYLHSKACILHRDIKSSNVLLDTDAKARISDVGLARQIDSASVSSRAGAGTFGYIDPEYTDTNEYKPSSDVFSFGVILLELLTGQAASDRQLRPKLHSRVCRRLPDQADEVADPSVPWGAAARELGAVAAECTADAGDDRPTARQLYERLVEMARGCSRQADAPPDEAEAKMCIICMDAPRGTRFRPCHHAVLCVDCLQPFLDRSRACPYCQAQVADVDLGDFPGTFAPPAPAPPAPQEQAVQQRSRCVAQ